MDDWITDALPLAVAAGSGAGPPVSPPDGAYPNFNGGFRAAISTESTTGFGRLRPINSHPNEDADATGNRPINIGHFASVSFWAKGLIVNGGQGWN